MGAVAVDTHGAEVHHMDIETALHDRGQQVVGAVDVVVDGVALGGAALHRIGRSPLFGEMHHRIRLFVLQQVEQTLVLVGNVHVDKAHRLATDLFPGLEALADAHDRREGFHLEIDIDLAAAEVIDDQHLMALIRQVHRTGPAAEAVTAENENFHPKLLQERAKRSLRASYYRDLPEQFFS